MVTSEEIRVNESKVAGIECGSQRAVALECEVVIVAESANS